MNFFSFLVLFLRAGLDLVVESNNKTFGLVVLGMIRNQPLAELKFFGYAFFFPETVVLHSHHSHPSLIILISDFGGGSSASAHAEVELGKGNTGKCQTHHIFPVVTRGIQ